MSWEGLDIEEIDARGRFILSRAKPDHPDQWLVNRLISDYVPFDYISRFIFNKPAFYADFDGWSENLQEHVVKRVRQTYLKDKAGMRERMYGNRG